MDYLTSPKDKFTQNNFMTDEINFKTPKDKRLQPRFSPSPDFTPFSYSSPVKSGSRMNNFRGHKNKRYFNLSDSGGGGNSNFNSPFHKHRRTGGGNFGRGGHNRQRLSGDIPISAYVDSSMTEDPWFELERELERSQKLRSSSLNASPSQQFDLSVNTSTGKPAVD